MARPRLAIIVSFVGRAPLWLPAFLVSCRANRDIEWLIYTDVDMGDELPPNVTVKPMTVTELNARFSDALQTRIAIHPLKLNDLKLTYGIAFAEDIRGFDFWAYADLDIVWGDLRRFLTDERLQQYDVFSSRRDRLAGHFSLFRNTEALNRAFELIPDVRKAMASSQYHHLDERGLTVHLRQAVDRAKPGTGARIYWEEDLSTDAKFQRALSDDPSDALWWRDGRTFAPNGRELMYIHFNKLKQDMTTINFGAGDSPRAFEISRRGFVAESVS